MSKKVFEVDFIGVGAPKCGTTWVATILEQHPDVVMPNKKELNFFNERSPRGQPNKSYSYGIEYYLSHWPQDIEDKAKVGEFSVSYLLDKKASLRIKKHFPNAKIVICTREPVQRAYSHYLFDIYKYSKKITTFSQAIEKDKYLLRHSFYSEGIKTYFTLFGRQNVLVIDLGEIKENPSDVARKVYKFVSIDVRFKPNLDPVNEARDIRSDWIAIWPIRLKYFAEEIILNSLSSMGFSKAVVNLASAKWPRRLDELLKQILSSRNESKIEIKPLDPKNQDQIGRLFTEERKDLERLLRKQLRYWDY